MNFMFEWQEQYLMNERKRMSDILFLPQEHKIHIFEPMCNFVLFIIWGLNIKHKTKA